MAGIRIRWGGVARVAAIVMVALIVVRLLPGFLRAPEPPPLGADVGLPKAASATEPDPAAIRPHGQPRRSRPQRSNPRPVPDAPASKAVIGSRRRHRVDKDRVHRNPHPDHDDAARARPEPLPEMTPPPAPEYVPPPAPEPIPEAVPAPPPAPGSTPGDGSEEFAPH